VNEHQAAELARLLSSRGKVTVTAQENGAHIVIQNATGTGKFTIRDGPSALLNYLLPGHPGLRKGDHDEPAPRRT